MQKKVWKGREKVKIKIFVPSISYLIRNRELKKEKKLKKHHYDLFLMPEQVWKGRERVKVKIFIPIISYPTPNREFKKENSKYIQKS